MSLIKGEEKMSDCRISASSSFIKKRTTTKRDLYWSESFFLEQTPYKNPSASRGEEFIVNGGGWGYSYEIWRVPSYF